VNIRGWPVERWEGFMTLKWMIVVGVICACLSVAHSQSSNGPQRSAESALFDLENRWVAALVKGDIATLDSILVDSYVDTDEEAHRTDEHGVPAAFTSKDLEMKSIKLSDMHVFQYGDFAVVTGTAEQVGAFQGHALTPKIVFTDSFVLQNGKWRVVASQRTTAHG
jgi:hypothetical protein